MECVYCKKTYKCGSSLSYHQKTTKACLLLQNKDSNCIYKCEFCEALHTTKSNLSRHTLICKKKKNIDKKEMVKKYEEKEDIIEQLESHNRTLKEEYEYELRLKDEQIKDLKERLEKREKSPKIINKNKTKHITNNINILTINEVMTPERVEEVFKKHYNLDTLMQGMPGLAKFICDGFILKSSYYCTDRSRHRFIMNDEHGNKIEDPNCEKLVSLTAPGMKHITDVYETGLFTTNEHITEEDIHKNYQPISNLDRDSSKLTCELSKIVPSDGKNEPISKDTRSVFQMMREVYQKSNENQGVNKDERLENPPTVRMIGGFSLGQLLKYREGYRKRKLEAGGNDVEIKGPSILLALCEKDSTIKKSYHDFIKEV